MNRKHLISLASLLLAAGMLVSVIPAPAQAAGKSSSAIQSELNALMY